MGGSHALVKKQILSVLVYVPQVCVEGEKVSSPLLLQKNAKLRPSWKFTSHIHLLRVIRNISEMQLISIFIIYLVIELPSPYPFRIPIIIS